MAIILGTEAGALLVDGLGDGALVECEGEDVGFLRTLAFGLLQVGCAPLPLSQSMQAPCWLP